jgi:hypothetical protein
MKNESSVSAVSWAAVTAGAFVAAALSLTLLALGAGTGLSAVSPWSNSGASAPAVGLAAIIWLIVMQIVASATGGYVAGRLRSRWVNVHTDEVYFRDTAHGFLVWAVGLVITAAFLTSAATAMVGGTTNTAASRSSQIVSSSVDPNQYFLDSLFRSDLPDAARNDSPTRIEVGSIFANGLRSGQLPEADKTYLVKLVTANTGLTQADAENRVSQVFDEARQAADTARKAVAHSLYWLFLALLVGAFCASYAATIGGKQRDRVATV